MTSLLDRLKPVLNSSGVFYPNPLKRDAEYTLVLKEVNRKAKDSESHLNNDGRVLGFEAYQKLTGDPYYNNALISKKEDNPSRYIIMDNEAPVDHAPDLELAMYKAHEYILETILDKELLNCHDVYTDLLDTTKIGIEKFKEREKNQANLSAEEEKQEG